MTMKPCTSCIFYGKDKSKEEPKSGFCHRYGRKVSQKPAPEEPQV